MKMKKIAAFLAAAVMAVSGFCVSASASYDGFKNLDVYGNSAYSFTGYTKRINNAVKYTGPSEITRCGYTYNISDAKHKIIGYAYTYIGSYSYNKKIAGEYYRGALVKVVMSPQKIPAITTDCYGRITTIYVYGFSENLKIYDTLKDRKITISNYNRPDTTYNARFTMQEHYPQNNAAGSDSYEVSLGLSASIDGISGNIGVSKVINSPYCVVTDHSDYNKNYFCVEYNYKPSSSDRSISSARSKALFALTTQKASYEWTTNCIQNYELPTIYANFGIAVGSPCGSNKISTTCSGTF